MAVIGQSNTFILDLDASGRLITGYSRNPKKFKIASYAQVTPAKKNAGYYLKVDQYNAMRLIGGNLEEFTWAAFGSHNLCCSACSQVSSPRSTARRIRKYSEEITPLILFVAARLTMIEI